MSDRERTGSRDLSYSRWHRTDSLSRFIDARVAFRCKVIDIDWCEYCADCRMPLALIETQNSKASPKDANVMSQLAKLAGVPAYSVSYWTDDGGDVAGFRVRRLEPEPGPAVEKTPAEYAEFLEFLRLAHPCAAQMAQGVKS